jgi:hypothetical protein
MKKFLVSVGLAAAGTASLQAAYTPDLGPWQTTKMWSISASLRGFYDDNYSTAANKVGSYGFEVSPQLELAVPLQQTELGLRYTYGLYYYQQREELGVDPIDQSHDLDLWLDHAFSERCEVKVLDTLFVGQEPELLQGSGTPYRVEGNNIANYASITLNSVWTKLFATSLNYHNSFYDFEQSGATVALPNYAFYGYQAPNFIYTSLGPLGSPGSANTSLAGLLNRIDQSVALDFQWTVATETMAFFGVSFEQVNYLGDEPVSIYSPALIAFPGLLTPASLAALPKAASTIFYSDSRDNRSYIGYVGFYHNLLPNLSISARGGVQYTEYYNDPLSSPSLAPYVVISAVYAYKAGSYAQIGFNQGRTATDVIAPDASGRLTLDQESSVVFASINHKLTPKLTGSIIGNWQYSTFNEGAYSGQPDISYHLGLSLFYSFTPHFSADAGYNFDDYQSNIYQRGYTRNMVYLGFTAAY